MDGSDHGSDDAVSRARRAAVHLKAGADRIEAERRVPADLMAVLHENRLFRLALPTALGGDAASLATLAEVAEVIAAADASTAWCVGQGAGCAMTAAWLDPDVAHRVFGPADAILAWGAGAVGKATRTKDGGWRVSGRWSFASGSPPATWFGAHCKVFDTAGEPILRADGRHAERTLIVPRAEVRYEDDWDVMGLRGTGSGSYVIENRHVAAELALDREDLSAIRFPGTLFKFSQLIAYAASFGGLACGLARGTIEELKELAGVKLPRGAASSLRDSPLFHAQIAQLEARLRMARAYHLATMHDIWRRVEAGEPLSLDIRIDSRLACTFAINEATEVTVEAYRAAGQHALFRSAPFERRVRDALSASQHVQGRPSHYTTVGRHLLGLPPDAMMFI